MQNPLRKNSSGFFHGAMLAAVFGLLGALMLALPPRAQGARRDVRHDTRDIRRDKRDLRADKRNPNSNPRDIRQDRRDTKDIRRGKRDRRADIRH